MLSDGELHLVADSIPHIVWVAAPGGAIGYVNRRATEYTGLPGESHYDWDWLLLVHPDDVGQARDGWEAATRAEVPYERNYRLRRADGEFRWHCFRSLPVRDGDGRIVRWGGGTSHGGRRAFPADPAGTRQPARRAPRGARSRARRRHPGASRDVGLTAKLLQLSNSAFFGARARVASVESVVNALGLPTIQAVVDAGQLLWSSVAWDPAVERDLSTSWRHGVATAVLVASMASPANRPYAQAAALLQDVGRFACFAGGGIGGCGDVDLMAGRCDGVPYRDVGVELLHLWGLPSPIITAVAQRDLEHRPASSGLGVAAAVRAAHLLIQQTESREPSDGTHDDELALLLAHPQLMAHSTDWRKAAEEASAKAGRWSGDE
jgi:PAS domain S-box-containing protein